MSQHFSSFSPYCRYMLGLSVVPAVLQFIGFIFLPESPRWLLQKGRGQEARQVLSQIRGGQSIEEEYNTIRTSIEEEEKEAGGGERFLCENWKNWWPNRRSKVIQVEILIFNIYLRFAVVCCLGGLVILRILSHGPTRRALIVGCGLQMFQQLSGINTVM